MLNAALQFMKHAKSDLYILVNSEAFMEIRQISRTLLNTVQAINRTTNFDHSALAFSS